MIFKGTVVKEEKNYIVVLTKDSDYIKLDKKGKSQLGKEIMFTKDDFHKGHKFDYSRYTIAAALILFIVTSTLFGGFGLNFIENYSVYGVVSLDINPSLEFKINKDNIVKDIEAINDDGKDIISSEMIGMTIEDALILSINNAIEKEYLNENNNTILISKYSKKKSKIVSTDLEEKVLEKVSSNTNTKYVDIIYIDSDKKDIKEAKENNISIGKYELYKKINEKNKDIKINDLKKMKVTEIVNDNKEVLNNYNVKNKPNKLDKKGKDNKSNKEDKGNINKDNKVDKVNKENNENTDNNSNKNNKNNKENKDNKDNKDNKSDKDNKSNKENKEKNNENKTNRGKFLSRGNSRKSREINGKKDNR